MLKGPTYNFAKEDDTLNTRRSDTDSYSVTKALAEKHVLEFNGKGERKFRIVALRIATVYGERDQQMIPGTLDAMSRGQHKTQIGDNTNLFDAVSVENVARAHLLAAKALLNHQEEPKVGGEAFNITDGDPIPFWGFERLIWRAAGDTT